MDIYFMDICCASPIFYYLTSSQALSNSGRKDFKSFIHVLHISKSFFSFFLSHYYLPNNQKAKESPYKHQNSKALIPKSIHWHSRLLLVV